MTETNAEIIIQGQVKATITPSLSNTAEISTTKIVPQIISPDVAGVEITTNKINAEINTTESIVPEITTGEKIVVSVLSVTNSGYDPSDEIFIAGEELPINKIIYVTDSGKAYLAGYNIPASRGLVRGMTISAASIGEQVRVRTSGIISNQSWTWGPSGILYLQTNGDIDVIPPAIAGTYIQQIATIKSSMVILLGIDETTVGI